MITPGNCDQPFPTLAVRLQGRLRGDKGYLLNALKLVLAKHDLELVTNVKKYMKPRSMSAVDKILLRKRVVIETVFDQLKNISQIEHIRDHSWRNFLVNVVSGLIAYYLGARKGCRSITMLKN